MVELAPTESPLYWYGVTPLFCHIYIYMFYTNHHFQWLVLSPYLHLHTVDGRNPAPVDRWFIPLFIGFLTFQGGAGFLPSTVFHHISFTIFVGDPVNQQGDSISRPPLQGDFLEEPVSDPRRRQAHPGWAQMGSENAAKRWDFTIFTMENQKHYIYI